MQNVSVQSPERECFKPLWLDPSYFCAEGHFQKYREVGKECVFLIANISFYYSRDSYLDELMESVTTLTLTFAPTAAGYCYQKLKVTWIPVLYKNWLLMLILFGVFDQLKTWHGQACWHWHCHWQCPGPLFNDSSAEQLWRGVFQPDQEVKQV